MKRFLCVLLTGVFLLCACGCETTTPKSVVLKGETYTLSEGNYMTITDAFVEENSIAVKIAVDFASATTSELQGITLRKSEVEQPEISCDLEKTANRNGGEDIFSKSEGGKQEFFLVFTDSSIHKETELSNYVLSVPMGNDNDGNIVLQDAMALG